MTMNREGVDVSNNNGGQIPGDFRTLGFCFAKVSESITFADPTFHSYAALCTSSAVTLGGYHFTHPDTNTPIAEADFFVGHCHPAQLLAVDVEGRTGRDPLSIMGSGSLANWVNQFCARVQTLTSIVPYVYCNRSYLSALAPTLGDWPIWLGALDGHPHLPTYAGRTIAIEQYAIAEGFDRDLSYTATPTPDPTPTPTPPLKEDTMVRLQRADKDPTVYVVSENVTRVKVPDQYWLADFANRFGAQILAPSVSGPCVSIDTINGIKVEVVNPLFLAPIPLVK